MYLLDTHIFLGFVEGKDQLSTQECTLIEDELLKRRVCLSMMSVWEIAMLAQKERIVLMSPCKDWLEKTVIETGVQLLDLDTDIMIDSCNLPGNFHSDPADRMIVATARSYQATLITHDRKIIAYGKKGYVDVHH